MRKLLPFGLLLLTGVALALPPFIGVDSITQPAAVATQRISWSPPETIAEWTDGNGTTNTDLATLQATVDYDTFLSLTISVTNITSLTLSGLPDLEYVDTSDNASLTTINVTNCPVLNELYFNVCALPVANVNFILHTLSASNAIDGGIVYLNNQTPAAVPTTGPPDGLAAWTALTNRSWEVYVDE